VVGFVQAQFGRRCCRETIRRALHRLKLSWKKAHKRLGRTEPANTTAGLYAACVVFVGANGRAGRVADVSVAMLTSAGRCAAAVTSG
jgi:hypothetical protein